MATDSTSPNEYVAHDARNEILVGVNETAASGSAVRWATREAAACGCGLYIVHVVDAHIFGASSGWLSSELRRMFRPVVENAVAIAREIDATVHVRTAVLFGTPARSMVRQSRHAALTVVGRSERRDMSRRIFGSVTWHLLAAGRATVVVDAGTTRSASAATERFVVALDGRGGPREAMTFAFTAADTRRLPVHLVHAAQSPEDVDPGVVAARWRQRYPDVTVTTAAGHTSIAETMKVQCRPGDLLVLGRHHFRLTHQDVGATTRSILASLPCAVAVIGDAATLDMVTVADVMTDDVVSVTADTPLKTLAELIVTHRVSGLPVVDQSGKVVGVVSELDLLAKVAAGPLSAESMRRLPRHLRQKARGETASDVMTSDVVTVEADMAVPQAALTALTAGVRRLPVTDPAGLLVGIVTRSDLLRLLLCSDAELQSSILEDVQSVAALADLADADIEVKDGIVTVRGEAGRRTDLLKVSEDLRAVPGVVAVHNEMTYRSDDTMPPPLSGVYL